MRKYGKLFTFVLATICTVLWHFEASAQIRIFRGGRVQPEGEKDVSDDNFNSKPPSDRDSELLLRRAKEAISQGRITEGLQGLQQILAGKRQETVVPTGQPKGARKDEELGREDVMFLDEQKRWRSLKGAALEAIADLPAEARQSYEDTYGPEAKRMLADAVAKGDAAALEKVARLYLHTPAGREACVLLGQYFLDQDQPLQAALCLKRVHGTAQVAKLEPLLSVTLAHCWLQGGQVDRAKEVLITLVAKHGKSPLILNEKNVAWFEKDADPVKWLAQTVGEMKPMLPVEMAQWTMFRGNAGRNATSAGGTPVLKHTWFIETTDSPKVSDTFKKLREAQRQQAVGVQLPSTHALALWDAANKRDLILMRTENSLLAIDLRTGKRIWEFPPRIEGRDAPPKIDPNAQDAQVQLLQMKAMRMAVVNQGMPMPQERLWDSATYGTCSSDGKLVYVVHEPSANPLVGQPMVGIGMRRVVINGTIQNASPLTPTNKLVALDLAGEGKTMWMVGGEKGEGEPRLAGAYFLGPPLPLMGQLYCLVELNGAVQLCVLDPKKNSGQLIWMQTLAELSDGGNFVDNGRRGSGASPSFADGVLVCPTSVDSVVAVDLASRMILWNYRYQGNQLVSNGNGVVFVNGAAQSADGSNNTRWADSCATIAEGHVLLTPQESNELHCLNLVDGALEWKKARNDSLYVACIHKGKAVVVGAKTIWAYDLKNKGESVWNGTAGLPLPGGAAPSGRGVYAGGSYYLPLASSSLARIDLDAGAIQETFKSRDGFVPGNLITYKDHLISHGADMVAAFQQLEPLKGWIDARLKENPDHVLALTRRGEVALADGRTEAALTDLRRAYEQAKRPDGSLEAKEYLAEAKDLLVESMLTLLKENYAAHKDLIPDVEKLIELPMERAKFLRIFAPGEFQAGHAAVAIKAYLELADIDGNRSDLDVIDSQLDVRRDRWIQGQLAGMIQSMTPADTEAITALVEQRLQKVAKVENSSQRIEQLRRFLSFFGAHPRADEARDQLASLLSSGSSALEKEHLLQSLTVSTDAARRRSAMARLAQLLADGNRPDDAAVYYRRLQTEFADELCLADKTGRQLFDALPANSPIRARLSGGKSWMRGAVMVTTGTETGDRQFGVRQFFPLEFRGDRGPFCENLNVFYDNQQFLIGRDGTGQRRFRINLQEELQKRNMLNQQYGFMQGMNFAQARGHLVIVNIGLHVLAIDTLGSDGKSEGAKCRWVAPLFDEILGQAVLNRGFGQMQVQPAWGGPPRFVTTDGATQQPFGGVGPITTAGVCLQRGRDIVCLDLLSGEPLWARHGVPLGCDIIADDQYTVIVPSNGKDSLVLRTANGELVGAKRELPPREQRLGTVGRRLLTWNSSGGKIHVTLHDPCAEESGQKGKNVWTREFAPTAKAALVAGEEVAVMDAAGFFTILNMASGKPVFETTLEPESPLHSIFVFRSNEQYHLVTSQINGSVQQVDANRRNFQPPMGELFSPLVTGHVYAFDRATGKPQWLMPAEVQRHGLIMNQPNELPVLTFIRHSWGQDAKGGGAQTRSGILCLDKRNGRAAYLNDALPNHVLSVFDVNGDPTARTVKLVYQGTQSITLNFTDDPRPPEPPFQASTESAEPKGLAEAGKAVGGAIGRVFGRGGLRIAPGDPFGGAQPPAEPEPQPQLEK